MSSSSSSSSSKRKQPAQYDDVTMELLWSHLKGELQNYDYWKSTCVAAWDVTAYDMSLLKKSYNNKRMAHRKLKNDLSLIKDTFPKQYEIQHAVRIMRNDVEKIMHDPDNQRFWRITASRLNQSVQELEGAYLNLKKSSMNIASRILDEISSQRPDDNARTVIGAASGTTDDLSDAECNRTKKQKINTEYAQPRCMTPESTAIPDESEDFDLIKTSQDKSVAAIIKSKAEDIIDKLNNDVIISSHERKLMTNGLSSILDLSDHCAYSQRLLFSAEAWASMNKAYQKRYPIKNIALPSSVTMTWRIVCNRISTTRSIDCGMKYLYQVYPKYFDDKDVFIPLKALETILSAMDQQPYLLKKQNTIDVTEYDYLGNVWLPLFRVLFQGSNIRIKTHESTFQYTMQRKMGQYHGCKNVVGFKIDVRFLVDYDGEEYDLCSGEMARLDDVDKAMNDKAKLNRESKDDLDCILDSCEKEEWTNCTAWQFQSTGSYGNLCSIHIVGNGLYVVLQRYNLKLPSCLAEVEHLLKTVTDLWNWRREMHEASDIVIKNLTQKPKAHLQGSSYVSTTHSIMQRDARYSPPESSKKWRKPLNLHGYIPVNLKEKLLAEFHLSNSLSAARASSASRAHEKSLKYDANGWGQIGPERWHNRIVDEYLNECPYGNEDQTKNI